MEKFEYLGFTPTPAEKHEGIAEIKINGPVVVVLRYKIVARKDGKGYFPACAGYKMPNRPEGSEYDEAFMIDSRTDNDNIIKTILSHFHEEKRRTSAPSVFETENSKVPFIQRPEYQTEEFKPHPATETEEVPF